MARCWLPTVSAECSFYVMEKSFTMTVERLIGVDELAEWLGVPKATIYWLNTTGKGPERHRIGKQVKYIPSEVMEWIKAQRVIPGLAA